MTKEPNKISVGIVGAGVIGRRVVGAVRLQPDMALAGVADVAAHPTKPIVAPASDDGARVCLPPSRVLPPPHPLSPHPSQGRGRCSRSLRAS